MAHFTRYRLGLTCNFPRHIGIILLQCRSDPAALTNRELETLRLLCDGLSAKQIGAEMGVSPKTADFHLTNIRLKLRIGPVPLLVRYAVRTGIIRP